MSVQSQSSPARHEVERLSDAGDRVAFDAMFRAYADHLFEYCNGLLGDKDAAAAATRATFVTAYSLVRHLRDPGRLEPWLYALARRECTSKDPGRMELPGDLMPAEPANDEAVPGADGSGPGTGPPDSAARADGAAATVPAGLASDDTDELPAITDQTADELAAVQAMAAFTALPPGDREVLAAFSALRPRDRELIDLVYWRRIDPAELPFILGVTERRARALLTAAEQSLRRSADRARSSSGEPGKESTRSGADLLTVLPMARLPAGLWRQTVRSVFDGNFGPYRRAVAAHAGPLDADGFPEQPAPPGSQVRKLLVTSAVVAPAAAGLLALAYLASSSPSGGVPHSVALTSLAPRPSVSSPATATGHPSALRHRAALPVTVLFPSPSTQGQPVGAPLPTLPVPTGSPRPSISPTSSPKPTASPTPSKTSPSPSPTATSPSPSPTSPSPSPTSPSPTSPSPTASASASSSPAATASPSSS